MGEFIIGTPSARRPGFFRLVLERWLVADSERIFRIARDDAFELRQRRDGLPSTPQFDFPSFAIAGHHAYPSRDRGLLIAFVIIEDSVGKFLVIERELNTLRLIARVMRQSELFGSPAAWRRKLKLRLTRHPEAIRQLFFGFGKRRGGADGSHL